MIALLIGVSPLWPANFAFGQPATAARAPADAVPTNTESSSATKPASTDFFSSAADYEAAVARLGDDLAAIVRERKLLLVWVVGESESMADDRKQVAAQACKLQKRLVPKPTAHARPNHEAPVRVGVVSYGARHRNHTPTALDDPEAIAAVFEFESDPSGESLQCPALEFAVLTYRQLAEREERRLVFVLVTDESGDMSTNITKFEPTLARLKDVHARVDVIGREAVFGYPYAKRRGVDRHNPEAKSVRFTSGPETADPETLQHNGFHRRLDPYPSGFGPYEQIRLARETGGRYIMLPSPETEFVGRSDKPLDVAPLRAYLPELSSRDDYRAAREASPLRRAVFKVIVDMNPYAPRPPGETIELRVIHFSIDRDQFAAEAALQTAAARRVLAMYEAAEKSLAEVSQLRDAETSPRWRADFDLLYAETISNQARLHEYIAALDEFVRQPKPIKNVLGPKQPTNEWVVQPVDKLLRPDVSGLLRDRARKLLREVVERYAGTPWAQRAADELKRGYGSTLGENHFKPRPLPFIHIPFP